MSVTKDSHVHVLNCHLPESPPTHPSSTLYKTALPHTLLSALFSLRGLVTTERCDYLFVPQYSPTVQV
jgi:hypothetical protein